MFVDTFQSDAVARCDKMNWKLFVCPYSNGGDDDDGDGGLHLNVPSLVAGPACDSQRRGAVEIWSQLSSPPLLKLPSLCRLASGVKHSVMETPRIMEAPVVSWSLTVSGHVFAHIK